MNPSEDNLGSSRVDAITTIAKGIVGAIPLAGSFLAEVVGSIIPNQRIDRVAAFVRVLDERLCALDESLLRQRCTDPAAIDLIEEGFHQAVRAITDERRKRIAEVVSRGLSKGEQETLTARQMLLLLQQLDEIDLIFLMAYACSWQHDDPIVAKNWDILGPVAVHMNSPLEDREKDAMRKMRIAKLEALGLTFAPARLDSRREPVFDKSTGDFKRDTARITRLGKMLLSYADRREE